MSNKFRVNEMVVCSLLMQLGIERTTNDDKHEVHLIDTL